MRRNVSAGATAAQFTSTSSRPARRYRLVDRPRRPVGARQVRHDREGRMTARLGCRVRAFLIDVGDRYGPAARRHLPAHRSAEALRAARDQDDPAGAAGLINVHGTSHPFNPPPPTRTMP
jgi:hypothetical protein